MLDDALRQFVNFLHFDHGTPSLENAPAVEGLPLIAQGIIQDVPVEFKDLLDSVRLAPFKGQPATMGGRQREKTLIV
ncbi:MAG: hypothetical protein WA821_19660 [Anaerolineales bacterium]